MSSRKREYDRVGFWTERGVLARSEIDGLGRAFENAHPPRPGMDPLERYPRVMHPHRTMPSVRSLLFDPRLVGVVEDLGGEPVLAAQSMFYWKPPGARGQAMHQDNFYLQASPGTCVAAWIAVDRADADNGGLEIVPGTQSLDIRCPESDADPSLSFTREIVRVPSGRVQALLEPGDVLFFGGSIVHGSGPNRSDRFRRSLIMHYVPERCQSVAGYYFPLLDTRGNAVARNVSLGGGPCGAEITAPH
jgi:phytanoyl-CoA hydroxylase